MSVLLTAFVGSAQLPSGSAAPNFTGVDLDGNSHTLYDLLDQGYTVVLDVSATWCGPCWNYHTSGILEQLWEEHGPDGDQTYFVLMIEGDPTTNTNCLSGSSGCNNTTQGDWVTGTPYPIIDDANIAATYQITYFPTTFIICPSRTIIDSETVQPSLNAILDFGTECPQPTVANDASLLATSISGGTCAQEEVTLVVTLQNYGSADLTSATIQVTGGTSTVTESWSGMLSTFQTEDVEITVPLEERSTLNIEITTSDQQSSNNEMEVIAGINLSTSNVRIEYITDQWPGEFSWVILDENGDLAAEGGPYVASTAEQDAISGVVDLWLDEAGCYTFIAIDAYGDGMHASPYGAAYTDGSIEVYGLTPGGLAQGPWFLYDGSYTYVETGGYGKVNQVVSVNENKQLSVLSAYPNPTSDATNVNFSVAQAGAVTFEIVNLLGEVIAVENLGNLNAGTYNQLVDMSAYGAGVYVINIRSNGNVATLRVNVSK